MAARPITAKDRAAVKRLHGKGMSRNDIARAIKRSPSTVSKLASELGLSFDRAPQVEAATAARKADLAERRAALAEQLHDDAERLRAQLWEQCIHGAFGGKDNKWSQVTLDRPTFADQRNILAATSTAIEKSLKLVPPKDDGAAESRSVIGDLMAGLAANYLARHGKPPAEYEEPEATADEDGP